MRVAGRSLRHLVLLGSLAFLACSSARRYYLHSELTKLEGAPQLAVAPGPWPEVPIVVADTPEVPDDLVVPALSALMALPGATDACDPITGRPRPDASEYCVALYRTPDDWRVSWPIRGLTDSANSCWPPFGGVVDSDFGNELPVFGYAHNHPCGTGASSRDLANWPRAKSREGDWIVVAYATSPSGRLARDSNGQPIPALGWLATGHRDEPRFYKWDRGGAVHKWSAGARRWVFQAKCQPRFSGVLTPAGAMPECDPSFDW
ncbi:hypothetical protein DRW03_08690 [Corallococcus sp. H22C18031201]|nr:hypothetical protein DRW03_08690 [Corallococcus sp. H22C18031201]